MSRNECPYFDGELRIPYDEMILGVLIANEEYVNLQCGGSILGPMSDDAIERYVCTARRPSQILRRGLR